MNARPLDKTSSIKQMVKMPVTDAYYFCQHMSIGKLERPTMDTIIDTHTAQSNPDNDLLSCELLLTNKGVMARHDRKTLPLSSTKYRINSVSISTMRKQYFYGSDISDINQAMAL